MCREAERGEERPLLKQVDINVKHFSSHTARDVARASFCLQSPSEVAEEGALSRGPVLRIAKALIFRKDFLCL